MVAMRDGEIRRLTEREKYLGSLQEKLLASKKADQHQKMILASVTGMNKADMRDIVKANQEGGMAVVCCVNERGCVPLLYSFT
jgi:hypothetical protein